MFCATCNLGFSDFKGFKAALEKLAEQPEVLCVLYCIDSVCRVIALLENKRIIAVY